MFLARKVKKWATHQLISEEQANKIIAFEKEKGRSGIYFGLGGLGVLSVILGIVSIIAANWDLFAPETKVVTHALINIALALALVKVEGKASWIKEVLISLQAGLVMTFIALIGQVLQTQAPLWQPLGLWLLLTTPMLLLYARFSGIIAIWLVIIGVFTASFAAHVLSKEAAHVFIPAVPFGLYILFSWKKVREILPNWTGAIQRIFWVFVVAVTTVSQFFWESVFFNRYDQHFIPFASIATAGLGVLIIFLLNLAQREKYITAWQTEKKEWDAVLVVSFAFAALPVLFLHGSMAFVGALMFCLYWLFMGGMGLRLGLDRLWTVAVILIGFRLFHVYVDVMGSLALQGVGFIITGALFLGMAWGVKKIIQQKPAWLVASAQKGGQL